MNILARLFRKKKRYCLHRKNYIAHKWIENNTPMVDFRCLDCGYFDIGHVHAEDTNNWKTESIYVDNGHKVVT